MKKILFLCVSNSARSQIAEGLAKVLLPPHVQVLSAGSAPSHLHPHAITVLQEFGIDISQQQAKQVEDVNHRDVDAVITLCAEEICPTFFGDVKRFHWPLSDPAAGPEEKEEALERFRAVRDQLKQRILVLSELLRVPESIKSTEFHASIRVSDLAKSTAFYAWLLNIWPKEWTHRYATFICQDLNLNFVLVVSDGKDLHHDTLYHLGIAVNSKEAVVDAFFKANNFGASVVKPPRTTWKGTPLHELWLEDADGNLIEIYARLNTSELAEKPENELPTFLVEGTESNAQGQMG